MPQPLPLALSVDFGAGFTNAWSAIAAFIPKFIAFLVILLIGWFVAKIIARIADRVLRKVGFEKMSERSGIANTLKGSKYDATGIIAKVIYYAILLIALQLAFGVFGPNPISVMIHGIVAWLPRAIVALVIVVVAMAIARAVRDIVQAALGGMSYGRFLATAAWAFIVALGVIAALGQAGIATAITGPVLTAVLATIAGIAIVGVGGGLITPMRSRWERWLSVAESESGKAKQQITAYQQGREDARRAMPSAQERTERGRRGEGGEGGQIGGGGTPTV
ncbi:mechanosensitive ion channel family protein [Streptomyces laurentii]|uniref:mechanosensitive ion channel family protein n=1 Tax=Streptomyces laurentii TaxID=39478 RepID=UPI003687CD96